MPKARARIPIYVEGPDGRPLAGAAVYIRTDPGGTDAVIYAARTGAATLPNPQTSGADGRVPGYLERNDYAATVTRPLMDPYVEAFEATPGAADAIDADWVDDDATAAGLVAVRQADGSIGWTPGGTIGDYKTSAQNADHGALGGGRFAWLKCDAREVPAVQTELIAFLDALAPVRPFGTGAGGRGLLPDLRGRVPTMQGTHADVDALGDSDGAALASRSQRHNHGSHGHAITAPNQAPQNDNGNTGLARLLNGAGVGPQAGNLNADATQVGPAGTPTHSGAFLVVGHMFIRAI